MKNAIEKRLNTFNLTVIVVSLVIGIGIFRTAKDAAVAAQTPEIFFAAWIVGGLIAFCGALTFAEIGARLPVTGGFYRIFSEAYHPGVAFAVNGMTILSNASSAAGVALIGGEYIGPLLMSKDIPAWFNPAIAVAAISLFYGANLLGLTISTRLLQMLMIMKLAMVLLLVAGIFFPATIHSPANNIISQHGNIWGAFIAFGLALKATCFSYGGYQQSINFGGDVEMPKKTIPRSITYGMIIIIGLYLAVNYAYYKVLGFSGLQQGTGIAAQAAMIIYGPAGGRIAPVLFFIAVLAYLNVTLMNTPRMLSAMSIDGILPSAFGRRNKRHVFVTGLTGFTALCIVCVIAARSFERILSFGMFCDAVSMVMASSTIFIFRKRVAKNQHADNNQYNMRLYPFVPLFFITGYALVGTMICITTPHYAIGGTLMMMAFGAFYFFGTRRMRKQKA